MPKKPTYWQSSFLKGAATRLSPAERGRGFGSLVIAAAIITALVRCLSTPDEPIPAVFCTICGLVALLGWAMVKICGQWQARGAFSKGLKSAPAIFAMFVLLSATGFSVFYFMLEARLAYSRAEKKFTCAADHILFMLKADDFRIRAHARQRLLEKYTPEEQDKGYLEADLRALEAADYAGMGPFLAIDSTPDKARASIAVANHTSSALAIFCDGPDTVQLIVPSNASDSFELAPGDYSFSISFQGNYAQAPFLSTKHVVAGTLYKGVYTCSAGGSIALEDLSHQLKK